MDNYIEGGGRGHKIGIFTKKCIQNSISYRKYEASEVEKIVFLYSLIVLVPRGWSSLILLVEADWSYFWKQTGRTCPHMEADWSYLCLWWKLACHEFQTKHSAVFSCKLYPDSRPGFYWNHTVNMKHAARFYSNKFFDLCIFEVFDCMQADIAFK